MPAYEVENIGRQGCEEVLEMGFALPDVARAAHARVARGLREGSFNPAARLVVLPVDVESRDIKGKQ